MIAAIDWMRALRVPSGTTGGRSPADRRGAIARPAVARLLLPFISMCVGMAVLPVNVLPAVAEPADLQSLKCVRTDVQTDTGKDGPALRADTDSALLVGLRSKLPRLSIDASCRNILQVITTVKDLSTRTVSLAVGSSELQLYRDVTLAEVDRRTSAIVWSLSFLSWGPAGTASRRSAEALDQLLTSFAADYHRAGNP